LSNPVNFTAPAETRRHTYRPVWHGKQLCFVVGDVAFLDLLKRLDKGLV